MQELTLVRLCEEIRRGEIRWSRHYAMRIFQRGVPNRSLIQYALCDDNPLIIRRYNDDERQSCRIWAEAQGGACTSLPRTRLALW
jgi:hypothetical protein